MRDLINAAKNGLKSGKPAKRYTIYAILATTAVLLIAILTLAISSIAFSVGGGDTDADGSGSDTSDGEKALNASLALTERTFDAERLYSGSLLIFNSECPFNADSLNKNDLVNIAEKRSKKPESDADFPYYYSVYMDQAKSATTDTRASLDTMIYDYYTANNNDDNLIVSKAVGSGGNYESGLLIELRYYNGDAKDPISSESHAWLYANAYKYGFINTVDNVFRYVGAPHAAYMNTKEIATLEEYMDVLSSHDASSPLALGDGYYAFFVPSGETGAVSSKYSTDVSGNNKDGYIVTADKNTPATGD